IGCGFLGAVLLLIGIACGSGAFTLGIGLALGGGVGTCDSVGFATGFGTELRDGSGMECTGVTATAPMRPPSASPIIGLRVASNAPYPRTKAANEMCSITAPQK